MFWGLGFGVLGFRVLRFRRLGFRVLGFREYKMYAINLIGLIGFLGFRVLGAGFRVLLREEPGFRVSIFGLREEFRVSGCVGVWFFCLGIGYLV